MTSEQIAEFKQFGDRVSRDSTFVNAISSDSREARELASRLATTTSRAERAEASFSERAALAERLSSARERGETLSIDIAQDPHNLDMFMRYAEQYGGSSAAALAMFDAELARQGLRPNRAFSDGTALPASFEPLRSRHQADIADPRLDPDVIGGNRENKREVARFGHSDPRTGPVQPPSALRDEVRTRAGQLRQETESEQGRFDSKAEIISTPDGALASRKSLLKQSGKQVADDAGASIDAVKGAVQDVFKKKH